MTVDSGRPRPRARTAAKLSALAAPVGLTDHDDHERPTDALTASPPNPAVE
jgi:hypothetical protein